MKDKIKEKINIRSFTGLFILLLFILYLFYRLNTVSFYKKSFSEKNVYNHIEELSSEKYKGRLAGTEGNTLSLKYVENYFKTIGIEPAGDNGGFYQDFKSRVPVYNSEPEFKVLDNNGAVVESFALGSDFREIMTGYGGNGEGNGKLILIKDDIKKYSKDQLKDKIVLLYNYLGTKDFVYAIDNEAKAIVFVYGDDLAKDTYSIENKLGKTIVTYLVNINTFKKLENYAENSYSAKVKVDVSYKLKSTPNLFGKIEGKNKDKYVIISAHIDGMGSEPSGKFLPGALDNASGVSSLMEIAKAMKEQKHTPDKTVIFAIWNNDNYGFKGVSYYADNPIYPLDKSQVLILKRIGGANEQKLYISSYGKLGETFRDKISKYGDLEEVPIKSIRNGISGEHLPFVKKGIGAVQIEGDADNINNLTKANTYNDNIENISKDNIKRDCSILLDYIKYDLYNDEASSLFSAKEKIALIIFLIGLALIYFISLINKIRPNTKVFRTNIENIYYSLTYSIITKVYEILSIVLIVFFLFSFIANIPEEFNLTFSKNGINSNVSSYVILTNTIKSMKNILFKGFGKTLGNFEVMTVLKYSFMRTMKLALLAVGISFVLGTILGASKGFKNKKEKTSRLLGTLFMLSLPDVFVVLIMQLFLACLYNHHILTFLTTSSEFQEFIAPLICVSIIPTVYISRIAFVAVKEETKKEYVKAAKAKGLSNFKVFKDHVLIGVVIKVIDSLNALLTILISNLFVVEYLFGYKGIAFNIFSFYEEKDINGFIGLVLGLGAIYICFILIFKVAAKLVNPLKREGLN